MVASHVRRLGVAVGLAALTACSAAAPEVSVPECAPDNGGLTLPAGFCALVVAEGLPGPRHMVVLDNGDLYVALQGSRAREGRGVAALRDTTGDGRADVRSIFDGEAGTGLALHDGWLYFGRNDGVVRYRMRPGLLEPEGPPEQVVQGLRSRGGHAAKSLAIAPAGELFVNIGSPSNVCQQQDRTAGSSGKDPCEERETNAGIWRFSATRAGQMLEDGTRFAAGLRNTVALAYNPTDGELYGVIHGRDQLGGWEMFSQEDNAELPAEEFVRIQEGDDFGWPYCYYDPHRDAKVLSPEYGGDGTVVGRCADMKDPLIDFPAHWAPNGLAFYDGDAFPGRYHGGAFIAFHGSWNRAPLPQAGYNVVFVPRAGGTFGPEWEVFAEGFAGGDRSPGGAEHRPTGVAVSPDGSLYISDDSGGTIWRVVRMDR